MRARTVCVFIWVMVVLLGAGCNPEGGKQRPERPAPPSAPGHDSAAVPQPADQPPPEAPASEEPAVDMAVAEALFVSACTTCHKTDKVESYPKEELKAQPWDAVVKRMVEEKGAKVSPEDHKTIVAYLEAKYGK